METFDFAEIGSKVIKDRFLKAASEGLLLPVFDEACQLDVEYAKENGFTKRHIFVLRNIFEPRIKNRSNEEVLDYANEVLYQMLYLREIHEKSDVNIEDKKEKGVY